MKARLALTGLALGAVVALTGAAQGCEAAPLFPDLPQSAIQVVTATGVHRFQVWIAADDASRERGLMFVQELPRDRGMLFLFEQSRQIVFWMKDTPLPLDIIFVSSRGRIVNISHRTTPLSETPVRSAAPAVAVLELLGGTAERIGLKPGDRLDHPYFAAQ